MMKKDIPPLLVLLTLCAGQAFSAGPHYLDRYGPMVIYTLDQAPDDPNLSDTSGRYKGRIAGAKSKGLPKQVEGARPFSGKAWDFHEVVTSYQSEVHGELAQIGNTETTKGISASFWVKVHKDKHKQNHRIMGTHFYEAMMIGYGYGGIACNFWGGFGGVGLSKYTPARDKVFDGEWHHIVVTADFGSRRGNIVLYVDGAEEARMDGGANKPFHIQNESGKGHLIIGARGNGGHHFTGALDDIAFFDYPLTRAQIVEIYNGPVFSGVDQEIYLPDQAQLNGIAPDDAEVAWTKVAGPGDVVFADPANATTTAAFAAPGNYQLQFSSAGFKPQIVTVVVHPPTALTVYAGDPVRIASVAEYATLAGVVSIPGRPAGDLAGVTVKWEQVDGPGTAAFAHAESATTDVRVDAEGLYRLRLTAIRGGLSSSDVVTLQVGAGLQEHYALLLNPLYLLGLETPARRESAAVNDLAGGTCAELNGDLSRLPKMTEGARGFTGMAWDLADSRARIRVHNRFNIARLGDLDRTRGLAMSFWLKADAYSGELGRIGGGAGVSFDPHKYSQGVSVDVAGVHLHTEPKSEHSNLYNGQWRHIAAVADFATDADNVRLYVDGKLAATASHRFDESFGSTRPDRVHFWGCRANGGGAEFAGQLDDIAVFDRPLSEAEVAYLYQGPTPEQQARLPAPQPLVDAGADQVHRLPVKTITLEGSVTGTPCRWDLIAGPGPVEFASSAEGETNVSFGPMSKEHHNPDYRHYIFRLTAGAIADEVSVVFYRDRAPRTRKLSAVPEPGVHARILFSPQDLPDMRERFAADPYAQKAAEELRTYYAQAFDSSKVMGVIYEQLKAGKVDVDVKLAVGDNDTRSYWQGKQWLYGCLAGSAALALLEDNNARLTELATVLSRAAIAHLTYYRPNYPNKLTHDASGGLALAYDLLASHMAEPQRVPVRRLLSRMSKWRQSLGSAARDARENSTNWLTHHDQIVLAALAIEGEEGEDPALIEQAKHKLRTFLSQHGVFKSGYPHEGFGYFLMGMESGALSALALSRRGENLYETTNLYNNALMLFRSMPPGSSFISNHGDTGPKIAGHSQPLDWVYRYLWSDDPAVQYLSEKRLRARLAERLAGRGHVGDFHLMALLFALGERPPGTQAAAAAELDLPLSVLCPDKGYANMRSSWDDDAVNLVFRCQVDKYNVGHGHPDINSFELYANGTTWFLDPGKFQHFSDCHQTILIDGKGPGGSSWAHTWPPMPGRFVAFAETDGLVYGVGDAKPAYDYSAGDSNTKGVKLEQLPAEEADLIWADFAYGKTREDLPSMAAWRALNVARLLHADGKSLYRYNPVQRAFRTAVLVKGPRPYVLIVDDIQKDDKAHTYQWIGNVMPGTVEVVSQAGSDLVLKEKGDADIGNRLLVRVLQAHGLAGAPELVDTVIGLEPGKLGSGQEVTQVRITARDVVAPDFKILLYPFTEGQPLPETSFDAGVLAVAFAGQRDSLDLSKSGQGRTRIERNGQ